MASPNLDKAVDLAKTLSQEEQRRLRDYISVWLGEDRPDLVEIPPPPTEAVIERFKRWKPVEVPGKPVSETIIEERR